MQQASKISVIITTYNRPDALAAVLEACFCQDDNHFEIIIADDGSTHNTRQCIENLKRRSPVPLLHVWQPDEGFRAARARNQGILAASGDYVIFLDGDCMPQPSFISQHRKLAKPGYLVTGSRVLLSPGYTLRLLAERISLRGLTCWDKLKLRLAGDLNKYLQTVLTLPDFGRESRRFSWRRIKSCNLGVWRSDLATVNGFDESFQGWGHEDSDLVVRLFNAGVMRKEGAFATEVYHLWHKENERSLEDRNRHIVLQRAADKTVLAAQGLRPAFPSTPAHAASALPVSAAMPSPYSISIIIPAYNAAAFIAACLGPVLAQMDARHELIVVDDGSTDGTAAAARALFEANPHCAARVLTQANQGISGARNAGLAQASGEYILFIDSDDELQAGALAHLDRVIAAERPDVIATGFRMWHPDAPGKDRDIALSYQPETLLRERDGLMATFFADRHMYVWCKIFRRDIYAQLPAPVFPSGRLFEDVAVVPRLLLRCASLYYVPAVLLAYRQHPLSITRVISAGWCVDFASALASAKQDFEQAGASAAVRAQFDAAACHFYIGAIKNSYQLPAAQGKLARSDATQAFLAGLFTPLRQVLASMSDGQLISTSHKADLRTARQVRSAVAGSVAFHLQQTISRRVKLWQRMARTRAVQREAQAG